MRTKKSIKGKTPLYSTNGGRKKIFAEMVNLLANQVQSYLPMIVHDGFPHDSE